MTSPLPVVVSGIKAPISWAKARPVVFIVLTLLIVVLAIKYTPRILAFLGRVPIVGERVVTFAQAS